MSANRDALLVHLRSGASTTCNAWKVVRKDGQVQGFTDHDKELSFEGVSFLPNAGMTPGMIQRNSGLAVDNTEIIGALADDAISEEDLRIGRYDGAEVTSWLVNWNDVGERMIRFRGTFGEVQFAGGEFRVELRGLTEPLNHQKGRVYQASCFAHLGDKHCKVDLDDPTKSVVTTIVGLGREGKYLLPQQAGFANGFFNFGTAEIMSGPASGLISTIREDLESDGSRSIDLMVNFLLAPQVGDSIRLRAGCDKSGQMCREKFGNFLNFRGFPHIPGADWLAAYPNSNQQKDGGSRYK